VNSEKTKYMLMLHDMKVGKKHSIKLVNRSLADVAKFKYLGTTLTDKNYMNEKIKSKLSRGKLVTIRSRVFCLPACCPGM
jgi:hypothetical protein